MCIRDRSREHTVLMYSTAYNLWTLHDLYTFISLSGYKGLTKFIPRDCLNSTLIYIYSILFGYIPVHFIYWAEFELAMGQAVQYKYYIRQSGTVRQMNDPLLVKFIWCLLYILSCKIVSADINYLIWKRYFLFISRECILNLVSHMKTHYISKNHEPLEI